MMQPTGRDEELDRSQVTHGDVTECGKDTDTITGELQCGTPTAEQQPSLTPLPPSPEPDGRDRELVSSCPTAAQAEHLRQADKIRFVTADGERAVITAAQARRSEVLRVMLDSGMGFEMTDEGELRLELRGDLLRRIAEFLERGKVTCRDVADYHEVRAAARYLALDPPGIVEESVEPLGLRMQLKARKLVIDECDHFVRHFFTPYVERRLEKGHLEFTVDITDKITSTKKFVNVMERDTAANILKSADCRKLWVQRMQDTTQLRIQVKDTKDEHGEFINFRTSVRPADLDNAESELSVDVTGVRRAKVRRTSG
eukprot:TRINITY_DN8100_c1_g1_i1.p1 TRINITY_DN8100_c1_g1~~TRINITY_DN8100_c1_g1_i1.p1  ORF type:complete len:314 (+),score=99.50 TRINITY_DN8100_c1_g1_i1:73-1014(+)